MTPARQRGEEVARELAAYNDAFAEGERGTLEFDLERGLTGEELARAEGELEGRAFHIAEPLRQSAQGDLCTLAIEFEARIFWLPLAALVIGGLGVGIMGWRLFKPQELLQTAKEIAIPIGIMGTGAVVMSMSRRWPGWLAGGLAMAGGGYLAWRELAPPPPEKVPGLKALAVYEDVKQPVLVVESV